MNCFKILFTQIFKEKPNKVSKNFNRFLRNKNQQTVDNSNFLV